MKIIKYNVLLLLVLFVIGSCEDDNYEPPKATFTGAIVDAQTGGPIYTRQPDGIEISLIQEGYESPVPYEFWAMYDGTFRNTKLFDGTYEVTVKNGPFHGDITRTVTLENGTEVSETFEVEPYVRISNVDISASGNTITGSYSLSMGDGTSEIDHSRLICHDDPIVHKGSMNLISSPENDLTGMSASQVEGMSFTDQVTDLEPGTYYARIAVEAANISLDRNNYSERVKIVIE